MDSPVERFRKLLSSPPRVSILLVEPYRWEEEDARRDSLTDRSGREPVTEEKRRERFGGEKRARLDFCTRLAVAELIELVEVDALASFGGLWKRARLEVSRLTVERAGFATGRLKVARFLAEEPGVFRRGVFRRPGVRRLGVRPLFLRRLLDFFGSSKICLLHKRNAAG